MFKIAATLVSKVKSQKHMYLYIILPYPLHLNILLYNQYYIATKFETYDGIYR